MAAQQITVSAVIIRNSDGQVLTVRKRGTAKFMFPGGKPEAGESPEQAAVREAAEELGVILDEAALRPLGVFTVAAANEPGHTLRATVFEHPYLPVGAPEAEIEQLQWMATDSADPALAPLSLEVFAALRAAEGQRSPLRRLAVFTGAALGADPAYRQAAEDFARALGRTGIDLVYGGGKAGLMGAVADAALAAGAQAFGVIPQALLEGELGHGALTELEVVPDMHVRKNRMAQLADGFVALPGGAGTLEELFEVWTWQQLGFHAKPVALLDVNGFWQPLLVLLDHMTEQGFIKPRFRQALIVDSDPAALLQAMADWRPQAPKWQQAEAVRA